MVDLPLPVRVLFYVLIAWNLIVFLTYGADKLAAKRETWRVPEKTLLWMAAALGAPGAIVAIYFFRHKTQKKLFSLGVPAMLLLQFALAFFLFSRVME